MFPHQRRHLPASPPTGWKVPVGLRTHRAVGGDSSSGQPGESREASGSLGRTSPLSEPMEVDDPANGTQDTRSSTSGRPSQLSVSSPTEGSADWGTIPHLPGSEEAFPLAVAASYGGAGPTPFPHPSTARRIHGLVHEFKGTSTGSPAMSPSRPLLLPQDPEGRPAPPHRRPHNSRMERGEEPHRRQRCYRQSRRCCWIQRRSCRRRRRRSRGRKRSLPTRSRTCWTSRCEEQDQLPPVLRPGRQPAA